MPYPQSPFDSFVVSAGVSSPARRDRLCVEVLQGRPQQSDTVDGADIPLSLGASPKTLSAQYFYDARGSALFEAICDLPEYYLTRTERQILDQYAGEIVDWVGPGDLIELGSGSATKTRLLFRAYGDRHCAVRYVPIDVSGSMLKESALELLQQFPELEVHGLVGTYEEALAHLPQAQPDTQRTIMFLGSSLGNLNPVQCAQLFGRICDALRPGEFFLLGVDLQKPTAVLEAAYNDSQGVTAEFNLNMLRHLNWRFGGNFCLDQFEHRAIYNSEQHQIEMYLRSRCAQTVTLEALDFSCTFAADELLQTEISRKFDVDELSAVLQQAHSRSHPESCLRPVKIWTDPQGWYALILSQLQPAMP
ncbi:MAG TPA: L-histidine N(alpha)-methyltransferase [Stenomitos sp.]